MISRYVRECGHDSCTLLRFCVLNAPSVRKMPLVLLPLMESGTGSHANYSDLCTAAIHRGHVKPAGNNETQCKLARPITTDAHRSPIVSATSPETDYRATDGVGHSPSPSPRSRMFSQATTFKRKLTNRILLTLTLNCYH